MSKARFGIAALLTLSIAPAWAGDLNPDETTTSEVVATVNQGANANASTGASAGASKRKSKSDKGSSQVAQAGTGSARMESAGAPASAEERWLIEREGYRDGGY